MARTMYSALGALLLTALMATSARAQYSTWEASAGAIFLHRDVNFHGNVVEDQFDGEVLGGDAFQTSNCEPGIVTQLRRNFGVYSLIARYFAVDGWSQSAFATTGDGAWMADSGRGGLAVTDVNAVFNSDLHSFELSLGHTVTPWLTLIGGFRWLAINETLDINFLDGPVDYAQYEGTVQNNLYGFQTGALVTFWDGGMCSLTGDFKGGIYGNSVQYSGQYENGVLAQVAGSASACSFVGEIGLNGSIFITPTIQFTAGYHLLWITGLGLLTQQPGEVAWATGDGVAVNGCAFYRGLSTNLTFYY